MVGEAAQGTLAVLPGGRPLPSAASLATLARALIRRSARLAAMTLAAVLRHRAAADRQPRIAPQTLAVDGAVFAHMPGVAATMQETLALLLGGGLVHLFQHIVVGLGAAQADVHDFNGELLLFHQFANLVGYLVIHLLRHVRVGHHFRHGSGFQQ